MNGELVCCWPSPLPTEEKLVTSEMYRYKDQRGACYNSSSASRGCGGFSPLILIFQVACTTKFSSGFRIQFVSLPLGQVHLEIHLTWGKIDPYVEWGFDTKVPLPFKTYMRHRPCSVPLHRGECHPGRWSVRMVYFYIMKELFTHFLLLCWSPRPIFYLLAWHFPALKLLILLENRRVGFFTQNALIFFYCFSLLIKTRLGWFPPLG